MFSGYALGNPTEVLCGVCRRLAPPFVQAASYGSYEGGLRDLIHLLKYQQVRPAADVLGRMLGEVISGLDPVLPEHLLVVPVPLHDRKLRQRGFNQSELIARAALKSCGDKQRFELQPQILARRRETASQIGLSSHQRRVNMRGAFTVTRPESIAERDILLVDDVLTTGTTASECARTLRKAGASRVWVATVARTMKLEVARVVVPEEQEAMAATAGS